MLKVKIDGAVREYAYGTPYHAIAEEFQKDVDDDILLVSVNGRLRELDKVLTEDAEVRFLTARDKAGYMTYRRSALFLLMKAYYDVAGKEDISRLHVCFSLGSGIYIETRDGAQADEQLLGRVKARMLELRDKRISIHKRSVNTDDAVELFTKHHMYDKARLFSFRRSSKVNVYSIENFDDYYYGYMVPDTGYVKIFDLALYDKGFVLLLPARSDPETIPPFTASRKLFEIQHEAVVHGERTGIFDVGTFNTQIAHGRTEDIILMQEALQEKQIGDIAARIVDTGRKIVMIAGPSSSGKTTFSHRLSIQLAANGLRPHPIGVDDYFLNREDSPRDENGNYDYESIDCLDRKQFNADMQALLAGERVELPHYNFVAGKREYRGDFLKLGEGDVLVIEGIHCLNDKLSYALRPDEKFRIYISALTQLNIDEHNRIPTTDGRLIRRIIRDARTRGNDARCTIRMWDSVRRGEEKNIFPFQDSADVMFNSALVYELAVLKQFAEPLLYSVPRDCPEYPEAKRLLKFLDYFLGITSENVPQNSLLREFIGGGCFGL